MNFLHMHVHICIPLVGSVHVSLLIGIHSKHMPRSQFPLRGVYILKGVYIQFS